MTCDKWMTFRENHMDKFRESEIFHDLGFREGFSRKGWSNLDLIGLDLIGLDLIWSCAGRRAKDSWQASNDF